MIISIVTVVLNDPAGLRFTAESIKKQSSSNFEWIIVDGASSDETLKEIIEVSNVSPVVISEKDYGIYDAMNKGIAFANGDYLIFMNAGDSLANQFVIKMLEHNLEKESVDVLLGGTYQNVNECVFYRPPKNIRFIKKGLPAFHQSTVYRKELLDMRKFNLDYTLLADYEWLAAQCLSGVTVGYLNEPLSNYHVGGLSYTETNKKFLDMFSVKYKVLGCSKLMSVSTALLAAMKTAIVMHVIYRLCGLSSSKRHSEVRYGNHDSRHSEYYRYEKENRFIE